MADPIEPHERLRELEARICEAVPPIDPESCCWLVSDASPSYCWEHARDARWEEMGNVGPTWPDCDRWWRRDDIQENIAEGIDGYMPRCPGNSDSSEACDTCGRTLEYHFTDYGVSEELSHFAEYPVQPTDVINGEHTYLLTRIFVNLEWSGADPDKVAAAIVIAESTLAAIEHGNVARLPSLPGGHHG